jgi:hypothetical protein
VTEAFVGAVSQIEAVSGEPLIAIGRTLDMALFSFGPEISWPGGQEGSKTRPRFALHVLCSFEMRYQSRPILDRADMRKKLTDAAAAELRSAGWELDGEWPTLFDAKEYSLRSVLVGERPVVCDFCLRPDGHFSLSLTSEVTIRVIPPRSAESEQWRFLDRLGRHVVVFPWDNV